ncbi:MAG: hypothetical protein SP1CHLAM54_03170 [Chlamydiia bacterium]|nr:hypothetical protein [Chlamydiia bacterium]MCH9615233.1 hypothetical protein [Chlamydiia bacterium]MCH9628445.1 hypothetical protein [Chlamydiia bacterium]
MVEGVSGSTPTSFNPEDMNSKGGSVDYTAAKQAGEGILAETQSDGTINSGQESTVLSQLQTLNTWVKSNMPKPPATPSEQMTKLAQNTESAITDLKSGRNASPQIQYVRTYFKAINDFGTFSDALKTLGNDMQTLLNQYFDISKTYGSDTKGLEQAWNKFSASPEVKTEVKTIQSDLTTVQNADVFSAYGPSNEGGDNFFPNMNSGYWGMQMGNLEQMVPEYLSNLTDGSNSVQDSEQYQSILQGYVTGEGGGTQSTSIQALVNDTIPSLLTGDLGVPEGDIGNQSAA